MMAYLGTEFWVVRDGMTTASLVVNTVSGLPFNLYLGNTGSEAIGTPHISHSGGSDALRICIGQVWEPSWVKET